jgi:hypothetical protein
MPRHRFTDRLVADRQARSEDLAPVRSHAPEIAGRAGRRRAVPSLVRGGPFFRLERRLHLASRDPGTVAKRGLLALSIAWLPIVLMAVFDRLVSGTWDPLMTRSEVHVRLLLVLSLYLCGEASLEDRIDRTCAHLITTRTLPAATAETWQRRLARLRSLRDHRWPSSSSSAIRRLLGLLLASVGLVSRPAPRFTTRARMARNSASWQCTPVGSPSLRLRRCSSLLVRQRRRYPAWSLVRVARGRQGWFPEESFPSLPGAAARR